MTPRRRRRLPAALFCLALSCAFDALAWRPADLDEAQQGIAAEASGDYGRAALIYSELAAKGNAVAQYNLGQIYARGQYGQKNPQQAIQWYFRSAEQGYAEAQYELGLLYREGQQIPQNFPKAWQQFKLAAEQGHAQAMVQLASLYMQGLGVLKDEELATRWYRKAAENGNFSAQRSLSTAYAMGIGVPKDYLLSYMWLVIALSQAVNAEKKDDLAAQIELVKQNLTEEQIREAETQAGKCVVNRSKCGANKLRPYLPY